MRRGIVGIEGKLMRVVAVVVAGVLLCSGCGNRSGDAEGERGSAEWQAENIIAETEGGQQDSNAVVSEGETQSDETGVPAEGETQDDGTGVPVEEEAQAEVSVSLVMVGDILLHTPVAESGLMEDGSYDFTPLFANVADKIESADLALVNQEVIIGGAELGITGYPCFNAPYELGDALADTGFNVILYATNHAMDKGKKGVLNCLDFWNINYPQMPILGIHESAEDAESIYIYEQDGMKIAILNYTYGTNGIALPADMPYAVDLLEEEKVKRDLAKAEELANFVIVCPHWGDGIQSGHFRTAGEVDETFSGNWGGFGYRNSSPCYRAGGMGDGRGRKGNAGVLFSWKFCELDVRNRGWCCQPDGGRHGGGDTEPG